VVNWDFTQPRPAAGGDSAPPSIGDLPNLRVALGALYSGIDSFGRCLMGHQRAR
jgi:hypothetical protein